MLRIILCLLFVASPCFARDVVLYVANHDDSQNLFPKDVMRTDNARRAFAGWLATIDPATVVVAVPATKVEDLSAALKAVVDPSDTVRGVVLEGHSNPTIFYLSKDAKYSASELGSAVGEALRPYSLAPHFTVTLASCHTGQRPGSEQVAYNETFLRAFTPALARAPATVNVTGHLYGSNESRIRPVNFGQRLLHRTWVPHLIERIGDRVAPGSTKKYRFNQMVQRLGNFFGFVTVAANFGAGAIHPQLLTLLPFSLGAGLSLAAAADSMAIVAPHVSVVSATDGKPSAEHWNSLYSVWADTLLRPDKRDACGKSFRRVLR